MDARTPLVILAVGRYQQVAIMHMMMMMVAAAVVALIEIRLTAIIKRRLHCLFWSPIQVRWRLGGFREFNLNGCNLPRKYANCLGGIMSIEGADSLGQTRIFGSGKIGSGGKADSGSSRMRSEFRICKLDLPLRQLDQF